MSGNDDTSTPEPVEPRTDAPDPPPLDLDDDDGQDDGERRSRLGRFAKRLMDRRELAEDTRELLVGLLATSDRAKTEAVRMAAREVRHYLDELKLKEELLRVMTSYSLEISLHLKPLAEAGEVPETEPSEPEVDEGETDG